MTEREPTKEEIEGLIESVFTVLHPTPELSWVKTPHGVAVHLIVTRKIGSSQHLFYLEPIAEELLRLCPHNTAHTLLGMILSKLRLGFTTAIANVIESAGLELNEIQEASDRLNQKNIKRPTLKQPNELRIAALKRMDARNRLLVENPRTGPQATLSPERLSMAAAILRREGRPLERIRAKDLAEMLDCEEKSIHRALNRRGTTLKMLLGDLKAWPGKVDN